MGPQGKMGSTTRYTAIPGADVDQQQASSMGAKERLLSSNGSGSVSGSPGRIHDNVSRDSGIGCLKVKAHLQSRCLSDKTSLSDVHSILAPHIAVTQNSPNNMILLPFQILMKRSKYLEKLIPGNQVIIIILITDAFLYVG